MPTPKQGRSGKSRPAASLAATLSTVIVSFMVLAFLIFGGLLLLLYVQSHQVVISGNQRHVAQDAARTVSGFISEKTDFLAMVFLLDDVLAWPPEKTRRFLQGILGVQRAFRSLALVDDRHRVVAQVSRLATYASGGFGGRLETNPPVWGSLSGIHISPVYIDPATSEPLVILAVPVRNAFREYVGYAAAELNLKFMWGLAERLSDRVKGHAYVVDRQGNLLASGDTARVLRVENVGRLQPVRDFIASTAPGASGVEIGEGIDGETVVGTYSPLGTPDWAVVVETPLGEAYRPVVGYVVLSAAVFSAFSILAGLLGVVIARRLAAPLVRLTETASLIAAGAGGVPVKLDGPREVVSLASAFNSMTSQLLQSHANLEAQLVEVGKGQEALRESEERFRNIINNANEIIYTLSPEGVFTFVSPAWTRLLGHPVAQVEGKHFSAFVHPDDLPACEEFLASVLSTGQPRQGVNYRVRHLDGTWRWHTSVGSAVAAVPGGPGYYVGIAQDVTWNKQAEEEKAKLEQKLFQAQKMESIGRLAGGVAHDFNNMLNVILGYAELIRLETPTGDPLHLKINEIERAAGQARDLTRQLLAFSRKQIIAPVSLDLTALIRDGRETLARLIGEDIDLRFIPAAEPWKVRLDPSQARQIVYNLALNARDAMPNGGKLTIETENAVIDDSYCREHPGLSPGNYVRLAVSDTGSGMDRETLSHLFEPFFTTKEVGQGTGLGLATVYGIVKQNGGFINVLSEPGRGTTFHIYFLKDREGAEAGKKTEEAPPSASAGTILLVEDDDLVRSITKIELEKLGYRVLSRKTPKEALAACEKGGPPFILLITDVVMPGMNGIELKKRMAALRPEIKVLFMSGYAPDTIVNRGVLGGDAHFLQKPFNLNELARKVREAIEG